MENWPILRVGSQGQDVVALQTFLNSQGFQLDVDGAFGPRTAQAVAQFQQRAGIQVDGQVGPQTYQAIATAAGGGQRPSPQPQPRPQAVVNPAPRQQQASTTAPPVLPVERGGPIPPLLGSAANGGGNWGPIREGPHQGPVRQSSEPYGPPVPQIATAQVQSGQDMGSTPSSGQQSANTFPVAGGGAYGPGAPVPRNQPPQQTPQPPGNYPMLQRMAMGGVYPGGNRPPLNVTQPPPQPYPGIEGLMADPTMAWPPPGPSMPDIPAAPASFMGGPPNVPNMAILPPGGRSYAPQTPMAQGPTPDAILGALVNVGVPPQAAVRVLGNLTGA